MSDDRLISVANLAAIENGLRKLNVRFDQVDTRIENVNGNVISVYHHIDTVESELDKLRNEIEQFRQTELCHHNLQDANENLVQINQKLDKQFGHYSEVRRTTTGILQATDIGIVHSQKITDIVEECQIKCPGYWLAPCLVALAAWINDDRETTQKALREAIRRNDEKTSLFFGLVDRRIQHNDTAALWIQRYLVNEDPGGLHRHAIVVVDAYASGLFPAGTKDLIGSEFENWLNYLEGQDDFHEKQVNRWMERFVLYSNNPDAQLDPHDYPYLRKYSPTWKELEQSLVGAKAHHVVAKDFRDLFETPITQQNALAELDEALDSLVTSYDDEELPLRKDEQWYNAVVRYNGDLSEAKKEVDTDDSLDALQDFGQLLTTASFSESNSSSSLSTKKYAIALSCDWAQEAYRTLIARNRQNLPSTIEMKIDNYDARSADGSDVEAHVAGISATIDHELEDELAKLVITDADEHAKKVGYALLIGTAVGFIFFAATRLIVLGVIVAVICAISGYGRIKAYQNKKANLEAQRQKAAEDAAQKKDTCIQIVRATCAEIVDFRAEYAKWDADASQVTDFFAVLDPENYIRALTGSTRTILDAKKIPANESSHAESLTASNTKE